LPGAGWFGGTSGGDFREALAPMVSATGNLTGAVTAMRSERTQPDAESLAMGEIRADADFGGRSGLDNPFTVVHMLGDLTLTAATDYVRAFGEVFREIPNRDKVPMYAHLVIARAALEACVVSAWLNEHGISRGERLKRGLSEFIYSAVEEQRVRYQRGGWARTRDWIEHATKLGWTVTDWEGNQWRRDTQGTPRVAGVTRPGIAGGIRDLLVNDEASKIGKLEWSRLSAVSHATWWGLRWGMGLDQAVGNPLTGLVSVPVGTTASGVLLQAVCILKALRRAADTRFELMGWSSTAWAEAVRASIEHEGEILRALKAAIPDEFAAAEAADTEQTD
jgi:hypothetical protein